MTRCCGYVKLASLFALIACLILSVSCQIPAPPPGKPCPSVIDRPSCVCNHPNGSGVIDVTSLGSKGDASFKDLTDPFGMKYSYNPCFTYNDGLCANVHACRYFDEFPELTSTIASGGTEAMYIDTDGVPYIYYTGPGGKSVHVKLHCMDSDTVVDTNGDYDEFFVFKFDVYSRAVCPGGFKGSSSSIVGGIGIAIIVISIVGVASYFIVGMIVMKVHYKASGTDIIPNKAFWKSLPTLIKDGITFTFSPCTNHSLNLEGYKEMES